MINAPNAILKDFAGAPFSVGKFLAYSASNSSQGIREAIFTQRLRADNFPPKGSSNSDGGRGASSNFRYRFVYGDARVLTYSTSQSCTLLSIARSLNTILRTVFKEGCDAFGKQRLRNKAQKRKK